MNIFVNNELVVLRGEEDILDYVEDNLGNDVRKAVEEPIRKAEKCVETVEYERDIACDGIRNVEESCLNGTECANKILAYLESAKRINRTTLTNMIEELQKVINPNYIEY